jgi:hypothetical protein
MSLSPKCITVTATTSCRTRTVKLCRVGGVGCRCAWSAGMPPNVGSSGFVRVVLIPGRALLQPALHPRSYHSLSCSASPQRHLAPSAIKCHSQGGAAAGRFSHESRAEAAIRTARLSKSRTLWAQPAMNGLGGKFLKGSLASMPFQERSARDHVRVSEVKPSKYRYQFFFMR